MKYIAEIVVFDSPLYYVPSNEQNKPEVIDIIEVDIISNRYNSYAILSDDIVIEMRGNYDDRWFIRPENGEILIPVPESLRDYTC